MKYFLIFPLLVVVFAQEKISKQFVHRNNQFTINVLRELGKNHENNVVFSAFPLETILGLTTLGAKGETAAQLKRALQLPESDEDIKTEFKNVHEEVNAVNDVLIKSANQIYLTKNSQIKPDFIKTAKEIFGAGVQNVDFSDKKKTAADINSWIDEKTAHKIKNLISEDQIDALTKLVLVNTLYFKGSWELPFDPSLTKKRDFHVSKNETVQVDTMVLTAQLYVHRNPKYKHIFLRLPYAGTDHRATITIVVPDEIHELPELQKNLTHAVPEQNYTREYARIFLPKFKVEAATDLKPILKDLGVTDIFTNADLSGITDERVNVDAVAQKVFIEIDELGTEATSASAAIVGARSRGREIPVEYKVDRPFFFCLQYDEVALLTGRIINPLQGQTTN